MVQTREGLAILAIVAFTVGCGGDLTSRSLPSGAAGDATDGGSRSPLKASDGGVDLGNAVPPSSPVCTSGVYWKLGDIGSEFMHPGMSCIACHSMNLGAPSYAVAGTVYPSAHEPDDCNGVASSPVVVITDATGHSVAIVPNIVGNFYYSSLLGLVAPIQLPYTAKVVAGGQTREMLTPQMNGDCNSCHTQDGANGAPGRIVAP